MRSQAGFTLIEIMVVVLIIAGLAYIVGTNVIGQGERAKVKQAEIQIKQFEQALSLFRFDNGFYPETQQGLDALVNSPGVGREAKNWRRYMEASSVPLDPWGKEFLYFGADETQDGLYDLRSSGPDGAANSGDDISSRDR